MQKEGPLLPNEGLFRPTKGPQAFKGLQSQRKANVKEGIKRQKRGSFRQKQGICQPEEALPRQKRGHFRPTQETIRTNEGPLRPKEGFSTNGPSSTGPLPSLGCTHMHWGCTFEVGVARATPKVYKSPPLSRIRPKKDMTSLTGGPGHHVVAQRLVTNLFRQVAVITLL